MSRSFLTFGVLALAIPAAVIVTVSQSTLQETVGAAPDPAANPEFYTARVKPILDANCGSCHQGKNHRGGLNMDTRAGMLKGGHYGSILVPGDPANSLLIKLIRHEGPKDDPMPMPPKKPKLSDADIAVVSQWVAAGAVMSDSATHP